MRDWLPFLFGYGQLGGMYAGLMLAVLVWLAFGLTQPKLLLWPVVLIMAAFPSSSLLTMEGGIGVDVYAKGAGYLVFSLYEISIMAIAACVPLRLAFKRLASLPPAPGHPLAPIGRLPGNPMAIWYWGMAAIVAGYSLISALDPRDSWLAQIGRSGVVYLLLQGLLVGALLGVVDSSRSLRSLMLAVGVVVAGRMLWGGVRYVALGGDPASFYESGGSTLKITFWDINDSVWACMLAGALVWLAATRDQWKPGQRAAALGFAVYCLAIVALSARRTAQGGALIAILVLWALLPRGRKWWVALIVAVVLPLAVYKLGARINDGRGWTEKIFNAEQKGSYQVDSRYQRFYELIVAWRSVEKSPVFGVGPAGAFNPPSHQGLEYHSGNYHFVHSGFGHVLLKTGFVGLALFCGLLLAYFRLWYRQWRQAPPGYRPLLVASATGFAAGLPNLISGTPLIELRTMLVMGFGFALPLLVARIAAMPPQDAAPAPRGVTPPRRSVMLGWVP